MSNKNKLKESLQESINAKAKLLEYIYDEMKPYQQMYNIVMAQLQEDLKFNTELCLSDSPNF